MRLMIPLAAVLLSACAPKVRMEMVRAADVTVPSTVQKVALIDRSGASNVGQGILGAIEGALTGEGIGADTEGRREALRGLREMLATSERYEVIVAAGIDSERSLFDRELSWRGASRICRQAGCDAIVALEAFDSDSYMDVDTRQVERTDANGRKIRVTEYTAQRDTRVLTAWRIYDPDTQRILDDLRDRTDSYSWTGTGDSRAEAISRIPSPNETVRISAYRAGSWYGRRIAPTPMIIGRPFYGGGSPELKLAKRYLKARDFEGAVTEYTALLEHGDPKVSGRASYNLAVAQEALGLLNPALISARQAAVVLGNGRSRRYVSELEYRIRQRDRVQEQLAAPPAPLAEPATPRQPGEMRRE